MASYPQQKLMTDILNLREFKVKEYYFINEVGIVLSVESKNSKVACPKCGSSTKKIHQNNLSTIKDIPWGEHKIYLRVNRRVMRCDCCGKKFREKLESVTKKKNYTERLKNKIITEIIETKLKNVAQRNDLSEQEVETMLKDRQK